MKVPADIKYVDYICLVNGISYRHMIGMAHFVRKMYKLKRKSGDIIPKIEGETDKRWMAMDLGNIALHIFERKTREWYDLESLWCLGEEYEKRIKNRNAKDDLYQSLIAKSVEQAEMSSNSEFEESNFIRPDEMNLDRVKAKSIFRRE